METKPYLLHALSPLHAGTGQSVDVIDLPIARMRSTGIPFVPGSSIKGVLRDAHAESSTLEAIYGPDTNKNKEGDHASAIVVGDARLVLLPVRSFKGVFAWVTCPLWLSLAKRDMEGLSLVPDQVPILAGIGALVGIKAGQANIADDRVYLEDLDLSATTNDSVDSWADFLAPKIAPTGQPDIFTKRFVLVDDETASFLAETATQVDTRIRLDPKTRVVAKGAMWLEESLPPESVLIGILAADQSRRPNLTLSPTEIIKKVLPNNEVILQFGGKATIGRGRCRLVTLG